MGTDIDQLSVELSAIASSQRSSSFVAISHGIGDEVVIKGNQAGLIGLAAVLVELAIGGSAGSHRHIDQFSGADEADGAVVFAKVLAPWEPSR